MTGMLRAALAVALLVVLAGTARAETRHIRFLHICDIYRIEAVNDGGGFARLASVLERERAGAASLTVFSGDLLSPSMLSSVTRGRHMIALMNEIGVDVATLGNHEFDFGDAVLAERLGESRFPWIVDNVTVDGAPFPGTATHRVIELGGVRVGLFGVLLTATPDISSPGPKVRFGDPTAAAEASVAALRAAGAEIVVAISHLPIVEDLALAQSVDGIDLVLSGHDHIVFSRLVGDTLVMESGTDAAYVGVVDLAVTTGADGKLDTVVSWAAVPTAGVAPDPRVAALVKADLSRIEAQFGAPIGTTRTELDSRYATVTTREAAIGNLFTDIIREGAGADIALMNGGNIRGGRVYPAGATLSALDIGTELPFNNAVVTLEVDGRTLSAALEHAVSAVDEGIDGRFLQVSGLAFTWDPAQPAGRRVVEVTVGAKPLDPDARYTVATSAYVAGGGDGYSMLAGAEVVVPATDGPLQATQVVDHIKTAKTVAPRVEGRIVRQSP